MSSKIIWGQCPDGAFIEKVYDSSTGLLLSETDENAVQTIYEYTGLKLKKKTEAAGTPEERITEYTYNGLGLVDTETVRPSSGGDYRRKTFAYNERGLVTQSMDSDNHATIFDYDAKGRIG